MPHLSPIFWNLLLVGLFIMVCLKTLQLESDKPSCKK
uniref:ATP synthase F0 subunit 8 n=1 Tax=Flustra foliacea TaxID=478208 RepID=H2EST6_9BILA|nr:ATP synthase F0 subunit 8 [Flustra foliacea]AEX16054.1 ATP synthase F0 subunit 8 [Flustra foliacea]